MITSFIRKCDDDKLNGLVVSESDKLILILKEIDFQFDGYQIVRKSDIRRRFISDSNEYCAKLMKAEGLWKVNHPNWVKKLKLDNWHSLFLGMKGKIVIVKNENLEGGFYIGPILDLTNISVTIHWFDALGNHGEPDIIKLSKITSCIFLDRYSTIHSKYLKTSE